jgi:hypothetical protein
LNGPWSPRAEPETNMELKTECLTAARTGQAVKIEADGHTFYLLSQQAYDALEKGDNHVMTKEEMDVLADEANALIAEGETDEYRAKTD